MLYIKVFDEIGKRFHLEACFQIKIVNLFRLWGDTDRLKELDQDFDLFDLNGDSAIDPQELREYTFSII
jgi:Ca2+-binding EF-hand superfamily protein